MSADFPSQKQSDAPSSRAQIDLLGASFDALVSEIHASLAGPEDHDFFAFERISFFVLRRMNNFPPRERLEGILAGKLRDLRNAMKTGTENEVPRAVSFGVYHRIVPKQDSVSFQETLERSDIDGPVSPCFETVTWCTSPFFSIQTTLLFKLMSSHKLKCVAYRSR